MKLALVSTYKVTIDPPLGLCYIASYLKKHMGFTNTVIVDKEDEFKRLNKEKPDVVGITASTVDFFSANDLAKRAKEEMGVPVIIGGVHITTSPSHFKPSNFDIAVIGEGEQTALELMALFEKQGFSLEGLKEIRGIIFRDGDSIVATEPRGFIKNIDDIPIPNRDLLDKNKYILPRRSNSPDELTLSAGMLTSRGCPYRCVFCSTTKFWKNVVRLHSPERVVEEIKEVAGKYKVDHINFWDDLFTIDRERVERIAVLLKQEKLDIKFAANSRANLMNDEMAKALKSMGFEKLSFGFESASEPVLNYLKGGNVKVEQNKLAAETCHRNGIKVGGLFIVGAPMETEEDMMKTLNFAKEYTDTFSFFQLVPLPATEIWEYAKTKGLVSDDIIDNYKFADLFSRDFKPEIVMTENITKERFAEVYRMLIDAANKANYKRLKFKLRYLRYLLMPNFIKRLAKNVKEIVNYMKYAT